MDFKKLAKECGVTERYIRMIMVGKRTPSLHVAIKLSKILGVTVEELYININLKKTKKS